MVDSVHFARWLAQFRESPIDFFLVSSSPHRRLHPILKKLLRDASMSASFKMNPISRVFGLPLWVLDKFLGNRIRGMIVVREVKRIQPHFVHAIELQNAGYVALQAFRELRLTEKPKLIVTNYGSDIFWYQNYEVHRTKLRQLMAIADRYSAECQRDVSLAKDLGFVGAILPVIPNAGGFTAPDPHELNAKASRPLIAIKGYQNKWGRALIALQGVTQSADYLRRHCIVIFSSNRNTSRAARTLRKQTGLEVIVHKKNKLTHLEVQQILAQSSAYIGLSLSDGISTAMLEAMNAGAIPIQSNTACINEWVQDGITGFSVEPENPSQVANALRKILTDEDFTENARKLNQMTIAKKAEYQAVKNLALSFYERDETSIQVNEFGE
jgi:glycosyltransferase involved in cell wall biosynthesis